jgi:exosortase/archaeosortase family protein
MKFKLEKKKLELILKFLVVFNLLAIPLYIVLMLDIDFIPLQNFFAFLLEKSISILGHAVSREEFLLYIFTGSSFMVIDVSRDCIGWKGVYTLASLVIATPIGTLKKKFKFLLIWIPILTLINFFRVFATILVGIYSNVEVMRILHRFLWQYVQILIILSIWYLWLRKNMTKIRRTKSKKYTEKK